MTNLIANTLTGLNSIWMLFFIMISAGLAKDYNLFAPAYAYVKSTFRSNKFVVVILSAIGGVLPVEGRVTISAGLLDTVAPRCGHGREKLGIVDYLSTHHYYLWSPLEKTVILPIAAFGLSYTKWLYLVSPLLVISFIFITWYVWTRIKDEEVIVTPSNFNLGSVIRNVFPMLLAIGLYMYEKSLMIQIFGTLTLYYMFITQQWNLKKLIRYVNWDVLITVFVVIVVSAAIKTYSDIILGWAHTSYFDPRSLYGIVGLSLVGFLITFTLGSSSKGVGVAIIMAQLCGESYFLWFFALDFAGYLLSPTHKCVAIGNRYFGTSLVTYYAALATWSALTVLVAGLTVFLLKEVI